MRGASSLAPSSTPLGPCISLSTVQRELKQGPAAAQTRPHRSPISVNGGQVFPFGTTLLRMATGYRPVTDPKRLRTFFGVGDAA